VIEAFARMQASFFLNISYIYYVLGISPCCMS